MFPLMYQPIDILEALAEQTDERRMGELVCNAVLFAIRNIDKVPDSHEDIPEYSPRASAIGKIRYWLWDKGYDLIKKED